MRVDNREAIERVTTALDRLKDQRKKLLHVYYEGNITDELFAEEQTRLDKEERHARNRLNEAEVELSDVVDTVMQAADLLRRWPTAMHHASNRLQRQFHKTFYDTIFVTIDGPAQPQPKEHTTTLMEAMATVTSSTSDGSNITLTADGEIYESTPLPEAKKHKPGSEDPGSRMYLLVPRTGFEPVLPP